MKKPETRLVKKIIDKLGEECGGYWVKIHGNPFQRSGLPDIMGSCEGLFFGLEVKRPGGDYDPLQIKEAKIIRSKGRGVAQCVHSPKEAITVVRKAIARAKGRR